MGLRALRGSSPLARIPAQRASEARCEHRFNGYGSGASLPGVQRKEGEMYIGGGVLLLILLILLIVWLF